MRGDDVRLRIVNVRVDEPRKDQLAGVVGDRRAGGKRREERARFAGRDDPSVGQDQQAVIEVFVAAFGAFRRVGQEME
jgi:hypothetical protein